MKYRANPSRPTEYWRNDALIQVRLAMRHDGSMTEGTAWSPVVLEDNWRHGGRDIFFVPYDEGTRATVRYLCIAKNADAVDLWEQYVIVDDDEPLVNARGEEKLVREFVQALAAYDALIGGE